MTAGLLNITREPASACTTLRDEWLDLENRSDITIFLSWQWLGHWLQVYEPNASVLRVWDDDRLIGMGLVVETEERRHGLLKSRAIRLHQTGHKLLDQIWIEYNGFLSERGRESEVAEMCLSHLCDAMPEWDEFIVGAIDAEAADRYRQISGLHKHVRWQAPCFGVDLNKLRRSGGHYLDTLSRNTRHQINRCHRLYMERGEVVLERPDSIEGALALFDRIGPMHLQRWGAGPDESGFANPDFVRFHRELIRAEWPEGGVDLVSVKAGGQEVASFYNLIYKQVVYFYLGGMAVENDNRFKPGLLGHSLCIEDYRHHGFHYYDFMGGAERYKGNLGVAHRQLVQISLQRPRFKLKLEQAIRAAKHQWQGEQGGHYGR